MEKTFFGVVGELAYKELRASKDYWGAHCCAVMFKLPPEEPDPGECGPGMHDLAAEAVMAARIMGRVWQKLDVVHRGEWGHPLHKEFMSKPL